MKDPSHPASAIDEIAFIEGSVAREGSFIAGTIAAARR